MYCHNSGGSSLASQPYISAYAHARAKVGGGREGYDLEFVGFGRTILLAVKNIYLNVQNNIQALGMSGEQLARSI